MPIPAMMQHLLVTRQFHWVSTAPLPELFYPVCSPSGKLVLVRHLLGRT
jgi:hypothetical protein